jgi:hypothetical protein
MIHVLCWHSDGLNQCTVRSCRGLIGNIEVGNAPRSKQPNVRKLFNEGRTSRLKRHDAFDEVRTVVANSPSVGAGLTVSDQMGRADFIQQCGIRFSVLCFRDRLIALKLDLRGVECV